jgi:rhamnogalacturonyl hydrolase YesR
MLYSAVRIDTAEHNVPYREAADRMARSLMDAPKDAAGTLIYRPGRAHDYVFADGIGMAALFLDAYGRAYGDERASGEAAKQLKAYLSMATDARTGLPYHGYETAAGTKNGLVGWGRAVGWLMMGMSGTHDAGLRLRLRDLARSAEELCGEDGLFPWLLTAPQGPRDVSATAMIRWAEARALENGALPASDREKFSAGFSASAEGILAHTADGRVGQSLSECAGFAEHPQIYGCYPWGQGAALAFLSLWRRP